MKLKVGVQLFSVMGELAEDYLKTLENVAAAGYKYVEYVDPPTGKYTPQQIGDKLAELGLTAYIPMLMDTGGNSGSQTSVTIIRGLSLDDIHFRDLFKVVWKELRVALMCSVTLSACNFVKLLLLDRVTVPVALTICCTLVVTVISAKLIGCILPMGAKKLGFDPAVMASPLITTIVDAVSLLVYFGFATVILHV